MSDAVAVSIIGGLFGIIAILVGSLLAQGRISRRRHETQQADGDPVDSPLLSDEDDDERVRRYEEDPGRFIRDVIEESKIVHASLREVRRDAGLVARVAYRAIRQIENLTGQRFPITDQEIEALERTTPLTR